MRALVGSVLYGMDDEVAAMVAERIPHVGKDGFGPCKALGVVRSGTLIGGAVFHNFKGATIEMSAAFDSPVWAHPRTLRQLYRYPFVQLDCLNLLTVTKRSNARARRMDEYMGFQVVGPIKRAYGNEDAILYQMPRENCRWIKDKD